MITSRLTSKAQTTIPQAVRTAPRLREGDKIAHAIEAGRVVLTRVQPDGVADDPFRCFSEWQSVADTDRHLLGLHSLGMTPRRMLRLC